MCDAAIKLDLILSKSELHPKICTLWQLRFMSSLEAMLMMRKEPKPQQVHHAVINELERLELCSWMFWNQYYNYCNMYFFCIS